jgi:hypothetical protein
MKSLRIFPLLAAALLLAPVLSAADFGVRAGRFNDSDENFVGAEMLFDLGALNLNPNIEYSLADDVTAGSVTPFIGAGIGMSYADNDVDTRTDILGNLIGGVSWNLQTLKPYAQVKYFRVLDNDSGSGEADDDIALTIGLRF